MELTNMHIAQIAPLTEAVPPKFYGGTERVIYWLTEELVTLGHDVTLYASGDSVTSAKLEAVWPRALRIDGSVRDPNALHMSMLERVRQHADEYDFLHFHRSEEHTSELQSRGHLVCRLAPTSTLFPYTTLFRSRNWSRSDTTSHCMQAATR